MEISKERQKKMLENRIKAQAKTTGTIFKSNDFEITTDSYGYTLKGKTMTNSYFSTLESVIDTIFENKAKEFMLADNRKTLIGIKESIDKARQWTLNLFNE